MAVCDKKEVGVAGGGGRGSREVGVAGGRWVWQEEQA